MQIQCSSLGLSHRDRCTKRQNRTTDSQRHSYRKVNAKGKLVKTQLKKRFTETSKYIHIKVKLDVMELFQGILFPGHLHTQDSLQLALKFPFQDTDILIVSYPKSGKKRGQTGQDTWHLQCLIHTTLTQENA